MNLGNTAVRCFICNRHGVPMICEWRSEVAGHWKGEAMIKAYIYVKRINSSLRCWARFPIQRGQTWLQAIASESFPGCDEARVLNAWVPYDPVAEDVWPGGRPS